jgi:branched-chain amino acid aminotransferase
MPVAQVHFRGDDINNASGANASFGHYSGIIKQWLNDIMYGIVDHEWGTVVSG